MVINVQMTMTNVEKWPCLINDCSFYEKKAYKLSDSQ